MSPAPLVSIVIPSRDNRARLEQTLASIARSAFDLERLETIVADDGSTDGTFEALAGRRFPFRLEVTRGQWANQSAATNAAIHRARGTYVLGSGADIVFDPQMIARHVGWHESHPEERLVVLGALPYDERLDVTPFMFYLVHGGYQFAYHQIRDPQRVPPNFLYAPNFSVRRDLLLQVGAFDERFPFGCQDTDLGIRLVRAGARIVYDPWAIGYHHHPVSLEGYLRRQELAGRAMVLLEEKHPEFEGGLGTLDLALRGCLAYADTDRDRDEARIAELEPLLRARPEYRELWERALSDGAALADLDAEARTLLAQTERLFGAYHRILSFHWARGYLETLGERHGRDAAARRIGARLHKYQLSHPAWRTVQARLAQLGLPADLARVAPAQARLVLHGVASYREALDCLEAFQDPPGRVCGWQVSLVCTPGSLRAPQVERLRAVADVIVENTERGIAQALAQGPRQLTILLAAGAPLPSPRQWRVAERVFERLPRVAALCAEVREGASGVARTLAAPEGEVCWLRPEALERLAACGGGRWPEDFVRLAERESWLVLALPELRPGSAAVGPRVLEPA